MGDHTSPGRYQTEAQNLGANKGSHDSNAPHTDDIIDKRLSCFANALHHALNDNGKSIERFGKSHHSENRNAQVNHLLICGENTYQCRCRNEKQSAGQNH